MAAFWYGCFQSVSFSLSLFQSQLSLWHGDHTSSCPLQDSWFGVQDQGKGYSLTADTGQEVHNTYIHIYVAEIYRVISCTLKKKISRYFAASGEGVDSRSELLWCLKGGAYSQTHVGLSRELALANPELTLPMFCGKLTPSSSSPLIKMGAVCLDMFILSFITGRNGVTFWNVLPLWEAKPSPVHGPVVTERGVGRGPPYFPAPNHHHPTCWLHTGCKREVPW